MKENTLKPNTQYARPNTKILMLLTNAFDPDPRVYQEAKSLVNNGYEVTIICWDRDYKKPHSEIIDGIKVERIYVRSIHGRGITQIFYLPIFWLKALFRVIRDKFDYVHCHDFDTLPLGYIAAKLMSKKLIYDAHESFPDMLKGSLPDWFIKIMFSIENFLIKRVDSLITVGSILEEEFKSRGAKNTCVVGNWKKLEEFQVSNEEILKTKEELGISNGTFILSYIGWFNKERKLKGLLEAVTLSKDVHLVIGGDGPEKNIVEEAAIKNKNISYLGYVRVKDIPRYTAVSDAVVYSFDKNNPNARFSAPNKLFEALVAGKAVVTGNFGEIAKIVKEEKCGVVLGSITSDNLAIVLDSFSQNGLLKEYQQNAKRAGREKYNWRKAEEILLNIYQNMAN